jgi:endonuclease-3 related protein
MISDSFELFMSLKKLGYIKNTKDEFWWPNSGTFEVIVGTILTQQTKWQKVEKSLLNLKEAGLLDLESLTKIDTKELSLLIKPSGFYNTKAKNLKKLCLNIKDEFDSFENFSLHVDKEWLLTQKGIGQESCDSILCYACKRDVMVVDSYTNRLLNAFGYEFENYDDIQNWLVFGIESNFNKIANEYENSLNKIYARFHGKIVEFCKDYMRGKKIDIDLLTKSLK